MFSYPSHPTDISLFSSWLGLARRSATTTILWCRAYAIRPYHGLIARHTIPKCADVAPFFRCLLCWGLVTLVFLPLSAQAASPLARWLQQARVALAKGDLEGLRLVLEKAEHEIIKPPPLPPRQLQNARLWLDLLFAQYHQLKGPPPSFRRLHLYEKKEQVQAQVDELVHALKHTKAAAFFLQRYNRSFRDVMRRGDVNDAITLTTTANRVQILKNTVRALQNQLAHMDTVLRLWDKTSAEARRMQFQILLQQGDEQAQTIDKIRARQARLMKALSLQATALSKAQDILQQHQREAQQKQRTSRILLYSGIVTASIGLLAVGVGAAGHLYQTFERNTTKCGKETICGRWGDQVAPPLYISGGIVAALGGALILVAILHQSPPSQAYQGIFQSHKHYLDREEQDKPTPEAKAP